MRWPSRDALPKVDWLDVLLSVDWSQPDPMAESLAWIAANRREREERAAIVAGPKITETVGDMFEAKPKRRKAG